MKKINYKKYFSNILWFTSTNLLAFVFLIPSIIDLFREESSVAFGQTEEETEDSKLTRLLFRALTFFIHLLRAISGFILSMSANILDYSINFATYFILNDILGGGPVYEVWSSVRDIGNLLIILFLGIIAVSLISGIFGQVTKKSVVWILGAALLINFSGVITTLVYTSGTVISKGFLTKSEGLIISLKKDKTGTSCKKGVAKCISAAVSITSYNESAYESELFKTLKEAKSDHRKQANAYYEKLAKEGKHNSNEINLFKEFTFGNLKQDTLLATTGGIGRGYGEFINTAYPQFNKKAATSEFDSKNQTERKRLIIGLISFVLNIILIVAFLYAALSLFYVGIGVVFLYIISPLGLVAYMITKTGIKSNILEVIKNAWWSNLWGYTFFTPVFLGGLWITISIYSAFRNNLSLVGGAKLIDQGAVGLILMVVMFLKSMEIANNVSGDVGGFIKSTKDKGLKWSKKLGVTKLVGGATLGAFKSTRDLVGHGIHKVSSGRYATQAHLRHNNRKKEAKDFLKYGLTGKNSGARGDREMEEARKEFEKKQDLSSFNILKAKEKEIHGRLGTVQSAKSTEAYREIEESLKAKAKDKKTKDEELAKLMTARNIAQEDVKAHEDADGRTRLQKRKTFLDSKKAIKQYKRDNPDAFNYHEQARKHKADELNRKEEMVRIGREKQSLVENRKKLTYDIKSLYKSNPKTEEDRELKIKNLKNLAKKRREGKKRLEHLERKEKNRTTLSSNIKGQQLKIKEKEANADKLLKETENTEKQSITNLKKETDKELNEFKERIDINDNIHQQRHKWNKNLLKQKKRQIRSDRIKSARDTLINHDGSLFSSIVNASKKTVGHGEESQIKEINKEMKTLNKERRGFKNKKEIDIENMYKEVEKKTAHQTDLINKERKEAEKKIEHQKNLIKNEHKELKKDVDTQNRLYNKAKESIKEKFVFDDHTKHLEKTGDFSVLKDGDKKKDKKKKS